MTEIRDYLLPLKRWWWLLVVTTFFATGSTYLAVREQPLVYTARTTLMVGGTISAPNPTDADFRLSRQLATVYAEFATREPVREATMNALGVRALPDYVVRVLPDSQFIEIVVTDISPERAQAVAAELANQLVLRSPTNLQTEDAEREAFVEEQIAYLEDRIRETEQRITEKQTELAGLESAEQILDVQADITALQAKLTSLQSTYASLLATSNDDAVNSIVVIEPAELPTRPVDPNNELILLVAAVIGFSLGAVGAYLLEYMDKTLKVSDDAVRLMGVPVLGRVGKLPLHKLDGVHSAPLLLDGKGHADSEAFRALAVQVRFIARQRSLKRIMVSSPGVEDGKTTVAINLALAMAQLGNRVILIDADLRKPSVHEFLGVSNPVGLSDLLTGEVDVHKALSDTLEENLRVITAGSLAANPVEAMLLERLDRVLQAIEPMADFVILDSAPLFLAESSVLASKADGVLLVARPGHTRQDATMLTLKALDQVEVDLIGIVLNRSSNRYVKEVADYYASRRRGSGSGARSWRDMLRLGTGKAGVGAASEK